MQDPTAEWPSYGSEYEETEAQTLGRYSRSDDGEADTHAFPWEEGDHAGGESESESSEPHDGVGLIEAFESFTLRAEKRVQELLAATDAKLFVDSTCAVEGDDDDDAPPPNTPSYILMSDQYRLAKPPQFRHWRECFPYLQVTGKSSFDQVPDEHIQFRSPRLCGQSLKPCATPFEMTVFGRAIELEIDPSDPPQEELILVDGEMEEIVVENRVDDNVERGEESEDEDDYHAHGGTRPLSSARSPRTSKAEETVDHLTIRCFALLVPPVCTALFERILHEQQNGLRITREAREEAVRLAHEAEAARMEQLRLDEEIQEQTRIACEAAVMKALEEERILEEQRREELLREQWEEHDEEEIKIRTLAYSHTREWYQPNKKCFSYRGRQMTYLKPLLKQQKQSVEKKDSHAAQSTIRDTSHLPIKSPRTRQPSKPPSSSSRPGRHHVRRLSSPNQTDLAGTKSPAIIPQTYSSATKSRPSLYLSRQALASLAQVPRDVVSSHDDARNAPLEGQSDVHLPIISHSSDGHQMHPKTSHAQSTQKPSWGEDPSPPQPVGQARLSESVAAPSRVYGVSPYRIPPTILKSELTRDAVATGRRRNRSIPRTLSERKEYAATTGAAM